MPKPPRPDLQIIPRQVFDQNQSIPRLVPGLQVQPADFGLPGGKQHFFLAIHPLGYQLRLSQQAYDIIKLLQETSATTSYEQAARKLSEAWKKPIDIYDLYYKVMTVLAPQGLLADTPLPASRPRSVLAFRAPLLPPTLVTLLTGPLVWLFHPLFIVVICSLASITTILFLSKQVLDTEITNATPSTLIWAFLCCVGSILWHELGHATACRRFCAPVGPIGFGLYFIFPAFYTDVSRVWQLTRKQRVVVDLGGIYFQSMALILLYALYLMTSSQICLFAVALVIGSILFSLNPFLRFDGYWMINDLLGVTALDQFRRAINIAFINGFKHGKGHVKQTLHALQKNLQFCIPSTTPTGVKIFLLLYVSITNVFWVWFFIRLLDWLLSLFQTYPDQTRAMVLQLQHHNWMQTGYMLGKLLIPCFIIFCLISLILRTKRKISRFFSLRKQSASLFPKKN
jgi:putative peptide zinc metalloprotease protein